MGVRDAGKHVPGFRWKGAVLGKESVLPGHWHDCWPWWITFPMGCGQRTLGPGAGQESGEQMVFAWV